MTTKRIFAIVVIFFLGVVGWTILGSSSWTRSYDRTSSLDRSVRALWGAPIVQHAPSVETKVPGSTRTIRLVPTANEIDVDIRLEHRRKGLVWYPTYEVAFAGRYTIANETGIEHAVRLHFPFPSAEATYEQLAFYIDDAEHEVEIDAADGIRRIIALAPRASRSFELRYRTRGLRSWRYRLATGSGRTKGLHLRVNTNFREIDFPEESLSPMKTDLQDGGMRLVWTSEDVVTKQDVGVLMPERINPGPLAARMSFFAPVCLLFFFVLISAISILRGIDIHPMHYLFVNAGFFAFHLLFAYLVDIINIHLAFAVATAVSVGLVVSYLAAALGGSFPWKAAAAGQLIYLVLFSYSFFLKGMTGITVTTASVITLALLMRMTAHLDWNQVFSKRTKPDMGPENGAALESAPSG